MVSKEEELKQISVRVERFDLESTEIFQRRERYQDITDALEVLLTDWELFAQ